MKLLKTRSDDGTKIQFARWNDEGEKDLLIVHGLAEHVGRYKHVADFFSKHGWRVTVIELRGHGQSEGKRGHVDMWLRYREDIQSVMACVGKPMAILAHSMGGLVTLYSLQTPLTPEVRCVALSNPLLRLFNQPSIIKVKAGQILSKLIPSLSLPNELKVEHLSRSAAVVEDYKKDPLVYGTITTRWGSELLRTMAEVNDSAPSFTTPLMINIGTGDQICSPDAGHAFAARYGGDCTLKVYEKLYHELLNEPEQDTVMQNINDWLTAKF